MLLQFFKNFFLRKNQKAFSEAKSFIKNSALPNGAIVTINSEIYPGEKNKGWHFVFPDQAALACAAGQQAGLKGIQKPFFNWLNKTENFSPSGVLYESYSVNGSIKQRRPKPEQNALVLWAIYETYKKDPTKASEQKSLINLLASGLISFQQDKNIKTNLYEAAMYYTYQLTKDEKYLRLSKEPKKGFIKKEFLENIELERLLDSKDTNLLNQSLLILKSKNKA